MTRLKVNPCSLKGSIKIPSSKSQSIRALLFGMLAHGRSVIDNLLPSPDIEAMIQASSCLGALVKRTSNRVEIVGLGGKLTEAEDVIDVGNSGLLFRFLGAVAALCPRPIVITGDHSIRHQRPIKPLLQALEQLGAAAQSIQADQGAPIIVSGPLYPGQVVVEGEDSQPVSGLLIATAFSQGPFEIFVTNPGEKPWVDLTLNWFKRLGIDCQMRDYEYYHVEGNASIEGFEYKVPADFSTLAFPLAAALLTGSEICIENLDFNDPQGDKKFISLLQQMKAPIEMDPDKKTLIVKKCGALQGATLDINACIDALPILAVIGCYADGETKIIGAKVARTKECDRISCIVQELKKMGALIEELPDGVRVKPSSLKGAAVHSHFDHRIALSLAIAGFAAKGETLIEQTDCVKKTFPDFCSTMQSLGANCKEIR